MIRIRSFHQGMPCPDLDVTTGSNRVAADEAAARAQAYDTWDDVQVDFQDGRVALRGDELRSWVQRHQPEALLLRDCPGVSA